MRTSNRVLLRGVIGGLLLLGTSGLALATKPRHPVKPVPCGEVMSALGQGKSSGEVAREMKLTNKQVLSCQTKAKQAKAKAAAAPAAKPAAAPAQGSEAQPK